MSTQISLPEVTLIAATSVDIHETLLAFAISMHDIEFGAVKLLTSCKNLTFDPKIQLIEIPPIDLIGYSRLILCDLYKYVDTPYCLVIQGDGFILNAKSWKPEFFNYDYIGAPWARYLSLGERLLDMKDGCVGNGGFSLRSKKLLNITSTIQFDELTFPTKSEDLIIGHFLRREMVDRGIRFPSPELAAQFSIESPQAAYGQTPDTAFGFHGKALRDLIFSTLDSKNPVN